MLRVVPVTIRVDGRVNPLYIYWTLVALVAWPCSLFSRCAAILVATWAVGQVGVVAGLPEAKVQVMLYAGALVLSARYARTGWCVAVSLLYAPLLLEALTWWSGPEPYRTWWRIYYVAMAQVLLVPFTIDWSVIRDAREGFRRRRELDDILRRTPYMLRVLLWIW